MTFLDRLNSLKCYFTQNRIGGKFQQSHALTSHFEIFWSIVQCVIFNCYRWRKEMEDQDITMLQLAGANMNPNDFLINIINKFNLVPWTQVNFMEFYKFSKNIYIFVYFFRLISIAMRMTALDK